MSLSISESNAQSPARAAQRARGRRMALILLLVSAAPIVAALIAFFFWTPSGRINYGELLTPRKPPEVALTRIEGQAFSLPDLKGKWVLVTASGGLCDATCAKNLLVIRQVRLMQGREMERVERVWLLNDAHSPSKELLAAHEGLRVARATPAQLESILQAGAMDQNVWLIDPLGNIMLRFPPDPDPKGMRSDLARLLKISRAG